jgi:hypothetical protein
MTPEKKQLANTNWQLAKSKTKSIEQLALSHCSNIFFNTASTHWVEQGFSCVKQL